MDYLNRTFLLGPLIGHYHLGLTIAYCFMLVQSDNVLFKQDRNVRF